VSTIEELLGRKSICTLPIFSVVYHLQIKANIKGLEQSVSCERQILVIVMKVYYKYFLTNTIGFRPLNPGSFCFLRSRTFVNFTFSSVLRWICISSCVWWITSITQKPKVINKDFQILHNKELSLCSVQNIVVVTKISEACICQHLQYLGFLCFKGARNIFALQLLALLSTCICLKICHKAT
jgi:hypothetical protein